MTSMEEKESKTYIGDSVYASFDGYHVILTTENGLATDPSNRIALEPDVLVALNIFAKKVYHGDN